MSRRSFAVIGLGRFGSATATTLVELGQDVIGIDRDEENVRQLADVLTYAVQLDATDEKALRRAGIQDVDVAVISIGENVEASLLIVMTVKELGIEEVIAKATTPLHGRILEKLGVSRVVFPEREMAIRVAHSLAVRNALDFIELSRDFSMIEVATPAEFVGKSLSELQLRPRMGLTLVAIKRRSPEGAESINVSPSAGERIQERDVLVLLGNNDNLAKLDRLARP